MGLISRVSSRTYRSTQFADSEIEARRLVALALTSQLHVHGLLKPAPKLQPQTTVTTPFTTAPPSLCFGMPSRASRPKLNKIGTRLDANEDPIKWIKARSHEACEIITSMSCDTFPDPENGYYRGLARIHMAGGSQEIFLTRGQSPQHAKKYVKIEIFGYFAHKKWICFGDYKSQFQFWIDSSFIFERLTTQAHGWTIFTATSRFNEFCQKQHIGIDEKCDSMILDRKTCRVKFSFRGTVFLSHQEGSSKKDARKLCDLDIVGQLCECGFIEKFGEKREIPSQLPMPRREAKKEKEE